MAASTAPSFSPPRHAFSREDVAFLVRSGLLGEDGVELIEGDLIQKMPRNEPHVFRTRRIARTLEALFGFEHVRAQEPIALSARSEPEPDVAVTARTDRDYLSLGTPPASDIRLVVEVSDTTLDYDLGINAPLYAAAGIPECWIVDVNARELHRHTKPTASGYQSVLRLPDTASVTVSGTSLAVADLLP